jgi:hypothetical protein
MIYDELSSPLRFNCEKFPSINYYTKKPYKYLKHGRRKMIRYGIE